MIIGIFRRKFLARKLLGIFIARAPPQLLYPRLLTAAACVVGLVRLVLQADFQRLLPPALIQPASIGNQYSDGLTYKAVTIDWLH